MSKIKVLMIDDNISLVEMVKEYFKENQKIELSLEAYNGEDGLNMILNKENEYDVILLDIIMPKNLATIGNRNFIRYSNINAKSVTVYGDDPLRFNSQWQNIGLINFGNNNCPVIPEGQNSVTCS